MLEFGGDQAVIGVDEFEAAAGEVGLIAGLVETELPGMKELKALGLKLSESVEGSVEVKGMNGLEDELRDEGVDVSDGKVLAAVIAELVSGMVADVGRGMGVMNMHGATAAGAKDETLEEGRTITGSAALPLDALGILRQTQLVGEELVPGDVVGIEIEEEDGPVGEGDGMGNDFGLIAGQVGAVMFAVRIGSGISRVFEDIVDGGEGRADPLKGAVLAVR